MLNYPAAAGLSFVMERVKTSLWAKRRQPSLEFFHRQAFLAGVASYLKSGAPVLGFCHCFQMYIQILRHIQKVPKLRSAWGLRTICRAFYTTICKASLYKNRKSWCSSGVMVSEIGILPLVFCRSRDEFYVKFSRWASSSGFTRFAHFTIISRFIIGAIQRYDVNYQFVILCIILSRFRHLVHGLVHKPG